MPPPVSLRPASSHPDTVHPIWCSEYARCAQERHEFHEWQLKRFKHATRVSDKCVLGEPENFGHVPERSQSALEVEMHVNRYDFYNMAASRSPERVCEPSAMHPNDDSGSLIQRHLLGDRVLVVLKQQHLSTPPPPPESEAERRHQLVKVGQRPTRAVHALRSALSMLHEHQGHRRSDTSGGGGGDGLVSGSRDDGTPQLRELLYVRRVER
mmetsp:Transcript_20151/g.45003  ORF Transcript_20151/g.45003 Transcript_20151/m.45003 type:complete len:211 (+) Transcript_20151:522-1154(+)